MSHLFLLFILFVVLTVQIYMFVFVCRWLIDCCSRLIAMTFDDPSFDTLYEMVDQMFDVRVVKVTTCLLLAVFSDYT